jgi:MbnP
MTLRNFLLYLPVSFLCLLLLTGETACTKSSAPPPNTASLQLSFSNLVNGQPMALRTTNYVNAAGETFNITMFKYYVSSFSLTTTSGQEVALTPQYFLVNEENDSTKRITLQKLPAGTYRSITFLLGVDSASNNSGAQTGALDPVNGMFWTWNSGYVMAKLEGSSPVSTMPANLIEFHIGGFKGANNALRMVQLSFPSPIELGQNGHADFKVTADAYTWFDQPNRISFQQLASCTSPGAQAAAIADNYKSMFTIKAD